MPVHQCGNGVIVTSGQSILDSRQTNTSTILCLLHCTEESTSLLPCPDSTVCCSTSTESNSISSTKTKVRIIYYFITFTITLIVYFQQNSQNSQEDTQQPPSLLHSQPPQSKSTAPLSVSTYFFFIDT